MSHITAAALLLLVCTISCTLACGSYISSGVGGALWQPPRRALLVIPGIAGSRLQYAPVAQPTDTAQVWLNIESCDDNCDGCESTPWVYCSQGNGDTCTCPRFLYCLYNSTTASCDSMNREQFLMAPVKDNFGLCASDDLDPEFWDPTQADVYLAPLFTYAASTLGYTQGKSLFANPYDWRQSNAYPPLMERMLQAVQSLSQSGEQPIDVLTHSMGGLVMRSFIAYWGAAEVKRYVRSWTAVAAPFQGAGKVVSAYIEGYNGGLDPYSVLIHGLSNITAHAAQVQWPSFAELLPSPTHHWAPPTGSPSVTIQSPTANITYSSPNSSYIPFLREVNKNNWFHYTYDGIDRNDSNTMSKEVWEHTLAVWANWSSITSLPFSFYSIFAGATPTPHNFTYSLAAGADPSSLTCTTPHVGAAPGDGTVELESARNDGIANAASRSLLLDPTLQHMYLFNNDVLLNIVRRYVGQSCIWDGPWYSPTVSDIIFPTGYGVAPYFRAAHDYANGTTTIGQSFNLSITDDCLTLNGQFAGKTVQFSRVIGPECSPASFTPCNEFSIKFCVYGFWGRCLGAHEEDEWRGAPGSAFPRRLPYPAVISAPRTHGAG